MDIDYPRFGEIVVEGESYEHDILIEAGSVRPRDKGPSKPLKAQHGHTPLSVAEDIPWSGSQLIIGSGYSGRLPVLSEVIAEAQRQSVEVTVLPTAEACDLLAGYEAKEVNAVLHVTC